MFGLFKSKDPEIKVIDKVWMSKNAKMNACRQMAEVDPSIVFVAWFEETQLEFQTILPSSSVVVLAKDVRYDGVRDKMVVFVEHHPITAEEQSVFKKLYLKEANVLSGMDEQLFLNFGGARTIEMMKRLGLKEDEVIAHSMISKSIRRAQKKIEKSMTNVATTSQSKWFEANIPRESRL
jgi:hypothetical protein